MNDDFELIIITTWLLETNDLEKSKANKHDPKNDIETFQKNLMDNDMTSYYQINLDSIINDGMSCRIHTNDNGWNIDGNISGDVASITFSKSLSEIDLKDYKYNHVTNYSKAFLGVTVLKSYKDSKGNHSVDKWDLSLILPEDNQNQQYEEFNIIEATLIYTGKNPGDVQRDISRNISRLHKISRSFKLTEASKNHINTYLKKLSEVSQQLQLNATSLNAKEVGIKSVEISNLMYLTEKEINKVRILLHNCEINLYGWKRALLVNFNYPASAITTLPLFYNPERLVKQIEVDLKYVELKSSVALPLLTTLNTLAQIKVEERGHKFNKLFAALAATSITAIIVDKFPWITPPTDPTETTTIATRFQLNEFLFYTAWYLVPAILLILLIGIALLKLVEKFEKDGEKKGPSSGTTAQSFTLSSVESNKKASSAWTNLLRSKISTKHKTVQHPMTAEEESEISV
jgi:hypothetical protein